LARPGDGEARLRRHAELVLAASLEVAERGEAARSQYRGAVVEELTARLLARRAGPDAPVRRERRVLFDGVRAEIHPYDVTVESAERPEVYDCKWGARGINADVLNQLDDAREHAADEESISGGDRRLRRPPVVRAAARPSDRGTRPDPAGGPRVAR
jgi:hypothetical protein